MGPSIRAKRSTRFVCSLKPFYQDHSDVRCALPIRHKWYKDTACQLFEWSIPIHDTSLNENNYENTVSQ